METRPTIDARVVRAERKMFLNPTELYELTGRKRRDAQLTALRFMGIEHRVRPDGTIAVLTSHVAKVFDGNPSESVNKKLTEPNWEAMEDA